MNIKFSRYSASFLRSFAMRDFNLRETEINQHYWSFVASSEYSAYRARRFKKINPLTPSVRLFKASGGDSLRIPATVDKWLRANDNLKNWLRQSVLVSAASNLEMYLAHVARTALASDPLVQHGSPRSLDGVCLLKGNIELPYEDAILGLTKGDWNSRNAKIAACFGICLLDIHDKKSDLEEIRKIRNEFAHGFGRNLEIPEPGVITDGKPSRLSEKTLKKHLGVISFVAKIIDRHLMKNHIGTYELLKFYHLGHEKLQLESQRNRCSIEECLKTNLYHRFGLSFSKRFCKQIIDHYDDALQ